MTSYQGIDVLEAPPNTRDESDDTFRRSVAVFDPGPGRWANRARDKAPKVTRDYLWTCGSRAEIVTLKNWLKARKGQQVPFWIPTWRRDFLLSQDMGATATGMWIQAIGYTSTSYLHASRRHLAIYLPSGLLYRRILSAADNGATETLVLDSAPGVLLPLGTLICQLLICRLATDEPEIVYFTDSIAECRIPYVEVPEEAP